MKETNETQLSRSTLYWVGSRRSDAELMDDGLAGSVCLYGRTEGRHIALCDEWNERVDNNDIADRVNDFIRDKLHEIAASDPSARFFFYNPGWKLDVGGLDDIADRLLGVNGESHYTFWGSKLDTHERLKGVVNTLEAFAVTREECSFERFEQLLGYARDGYILQADNASGGSGTLIVDESNRDEFTGGLVQEGYLLSKYRKQNIPVNYHAVIYPEYVLMFPGSVQVLRVENHHLVYKGADYIAYKMIDADKRERMLADVRRVCELMRADGYRGVVGIDGMIYGDSTAVIEVNTRFQGSTAALNIGLVSAGFRTVQEYSLDAFTLDAPGESERGINDGTEIGTSCYSYNMIAPIGHADLILSRAKEESRVLRIDTDGYSSGQLVGKDIYRFRLCFNTNICAINPEGGIWIHQNVVEPEERIYNGVCDRDPLALKIALMTQGVRIESDAEQYLKAHGGIREGNNNAVDVYVCDMIVNAPCDVDFVRFTPFSIRLGEGDRTELYYYDSFIDTIGLYPFDKLSGKRTKSGRYYADIAYLSTDRLRVHMTNKCIYKKMGRSCRFCNIDTEDTGELIPMTDIIEVVEDYIENAHELKHFLVGGQSAEEHSEKTRVVEIIRAIRERSDKNIYVMSLPFSKETMNEMKEAGMTELACNMEVYDDLLAREYMPGKGRIPRSHYMDILGYASKLYEDTPGAVRSALIIGLEPHESFMRCIGMLARTGVQPIVSVFRPLPNTDLERMMMPPLNYLYDVFIEAETLCREYGLSLGPECINCQNNTLSLPDSIAVGYVKK